MQNFVAPDRGPTDCVIFLDDGTEFAVHEAVMTSYSPMMRFLPAGATIVLHFAYGTEDLDRLDAAPVQDLIDALDIMLTFESRGPAYIERVLCGRHLSLAECKALYAVIGSAKLLKLAHKIAPKLLDELAQWNGIRTDVFDAMTTSLIRKGILYGHLVARQDACSWFMSRGKRIRDSVQCYADFAVAHARYNPELKNLFTQGSDKAEKAIQECRAHPCCGAIWKQKLWAEVNGYWTMRHMGDPRDDLQMIRDLDPAKTLELYPEPAPETESTATATTGGDKLVDDLSSALATLNTDGSAPLETTAAVNVDQQPQHPDAPQVKPTDATSTEAVVLDIKPSCICRQVEYGQMIACDDKKCKIEWFHKACVGITETPAGDWFCRQCTARRSKKKAAGARAPRKVLKATSVAQAPIASAPIVEVSLSA